MFVHQKKHVSIISTFNEFRIFLSATHAAVVFVLLFFTTIAQAGQISLAWDPNTQSTLGGYKVYYGQASGNYSTNVDVGEQTSYTVANLQDGAQYYFAVTAYDTTRTIESGFSNEVSATISVSSASVAVPTADFSASPTSGTVPVTVDFTNLTSGSVTAWDWTFGDGGTSNAASPSHTYTNSGTYTVELTATNSTGSNTKTQSGYITVSSSTSTGGTTTTGGGTTSGGTTSGGSTTAAFQQDSVAPNLLVMEAEHFTGNTAQGGYAWQATTSYGNYSGASALQALPEDNTRIDTNYAAASPRLDYQVNFVKTGIHYVWIRALGPSWSSDSLHIGLDGQEVASAARLSRLNPLGSWVWSKTTQGGTIATLNVTSTGLHTINVWMRESGTLLDKLVLTPDANYTPSDLGPDETVSTMIGAATLPSPWIDMDIGNVGQAGSASYASGAFTVEGSGADIWNNVDAFHFVFQSMTGDGSIVARVASIDHTNSWAKAGVMIRESLDADARHAMAVVTAGKGVAFQRRTTPGGTSYHTAGAAVSTPYWVKLTRIGSTFTAYQSADGNTWAPVGSATINMATSVYVGLALTSHNNSALSASVLDNVSKGTN